MTRYCMTLLFAALAFVQVAHAQEQRQQWSGLYDRDTLRFWGTQMPEGIRDNLEKAIWPVLTPREKRALVGVKLSFPLEDGRTLLSASSEWNDLEKTVVFPISSLRFFGDLVLAYAWLNRNRQSLDPVTDYLTMLKYQRPAVAGRNAYRPLAALGIPAEAARADPLVQRTFQAAFGSAVVFILGHELGHIYHRHEDYDSITPEQAQAQESDSDQFALEIMRRMGAAPTGVVLFFTVAAHIEANSSDPGYLQQLSTHPLTASRIQAVAGAMRRNANDFARSADDVNKGADAVRSAAAELDKIARVLHDTGAQKALQYKGLTTKLESLKPRAPGERVAGATVRASSNVAFDGAYEGRWIDSKGVDLAVRMLLKRDGQRVTGSYSFGMEDVTLDGQVFDDKLHYRWTWGKDFFGDGVLTLSAHANEMSGTWGYSRSETGGGRWELRRKN